MPMVRLPLVNGLSAVSAGVLHLCGPARSLEISAKELF